MWQCGPCQCSPCKQDVHEVSVDEVADFLNDERESPLCEVSPLEIEAKAEAIKEEEIKEIKDEAAKDLAGVVSFETKNGTTREIKFERVPLGLYYKAEGAYSTWPSAITEVSGNASELGVLPGWRIKAVQGIPMDGKTYDELTQQLLSLCSTLTKGLSRQALDKKKGLDREDVRVDLPPETPENNELESKDVLNDLPIREQSKPCSTSTASHTLKRTGTEVLQSLTTDQQAKVQELIKGHYIFEAYDECPEYVECKGHMKNFRDTVHLICGQSESAEWEKTLSGDLGDGDKWILQYRWGGAEAGSAGKEYLWVKLSVDQGIPWWKGLGAWFEPDLDAQHNAALVEAKFVSKPTSCYGIRCNVNGFLGRMFGYTQDYIEVFRYLNKKNGMCIECNRSVDHEDLAKRGYDVGKAKYKKGNDVLLYVISFPRSEQKSTSVLFSRIQLHLPGWLVNQVIGTIGPRLVRTVVPTMLKTQGSDPEYQKRYAEDKNGIYSYLKDFSEKGAAYALERQEKYDASNLPPASYVLGTYSTPKRTDLPFEKPKAGEKLPPKTGAFPEKKSHLRKLATGSQVF